VEGKLAMLTELLYQKDSYLQEFTAQVVATDVANHRLALNATAFYPGGGGQPCDVGQFSAAGQSLIVERVQKDGEGVVWHTIDPNSYLPAIGAELLGQLDWSRRYALMRTHTAMHILCGVVFRNYGALVTGGDMEPLKGRMDFEFESLQKEFVEVIEQAINQEVRHARKISVGFLNREQAFQTPDLIRTKINLLPEGIQMIRTIHIEGLDLQADGGTHVANTAEVGSLKIVDYKSKGKINKRIYLEISG
jgi:misacylated tRNA(Ala) deacylase